MRCRRSDGLPMTATHWSKFFWSDWASDEALKMCSPGAQALWMRMLCVCAQAEGYLAIGGGRLGPADMARVTGWPLRDVRRWWAELKRWGVFSVEGRGWVYSRRMVRDVRKAEIARLNGRQGGNPNLGKTRRIPASDKLEPTHPPGVHMPESRLLAEGKARGRRTRVWKGPAEVCAAVVAAGGEGMIGYLDACSWVDGRVVSKNRFVVETLQREVGEALAAMGVGVGVG